MSTISASQKLQLSMPSFEGAKELIRRINQADSNINAVAKQPSSHSINQNFTYEPIAAIVMKYGNRDIYKDIYKFIQ